MSHKKLTSLFIILILTIALFTNHEAWARSKCYFLCSDEKSDSNEELIRLNKEVLQLSQMGKYSEAIEIALKAVEVGIKLLGPEHPDTATALNNLAMLYADMGDYARAEPLYQRSLKIMEKVLSPEHPRLFNHPAQYPII